MSQKSAGRVDRAFFVCRLAGAILPSSARRPLRPES